MTGARAAGAALAALWLAACGSEAPAPEPAVRPVKILEVGAAESGATREYPGTIAAAQHAEMGFEVAGRVVEFPVQEGQRVEEGTELARLDPRDYQAKLDSARALVEDARTNYERTRILYGEGVSPKAELDRKRAFFEVQEANFRTAEKALQDTVLRAPFAGVVAQKLVKDYRNVQAKEPILILQDDSSFEMEVYVPERDMSRPPAPGTSLADLTARTHPEVSLTTRPEEKIPARIKEFATTADPSTRTFKVTLAFDSPEDLQVLPGMTAKVTVRVRGVAGTSGYRIPAVATAADDRGEPYVWIVAPDTMTVSRRPVALGELSDGEVTVTSGLAPGDLIAISGVHQLRDGMRVSRYGG